MIYSSAGACGRRGDQLPRISTWAWEQQPRAWVTAREDRHWTRLPVNPTHTSKSKFKLKIQTNVRQLESLKLDGWRGIKEIREDLGNKQTSK